MDSPKKMKPACDAQDDAESKSIKQIMQRFAERTSLNGVPFINTSHRRVGKYIWTFLVFLAVGAMFFHLFTLFSNFFEYKKYSKVSFSYSKLQFPAVTICNVNMVRKSKLHLASPAMFSIYMATDPSLRLYAATGGNSRKKRDTGLSGDFNGVLDVHGEVDKPRTTVSNITDRDLGGFNIRQKRDAGVGDNSTNSDDDLLDEYGNINITSNEIDVGCTDCLENTAKTSTSYLLDQMFKQEFGKLNESVRNEVAHQIGDLLLQCTFAGKVCTARNFTTAYSITYGTCYTIQSPYFIARKSGPDAGLELALNIEYDEYLDGITSGAGAVVVVHDQKTVPFPTREGMALSPQMQTLIGLRQVEMTRLGPPYGPCVQNDGFEKQYGVKYTQNLCQNICEQNKIRDTCKCYEQVRKDINELIKIPKDLKPCSTDSELACMTKVLWNFESYSDSCGCDSACNETTYQKTITALEWPNPEYAKLIVASVCQKNPGHLCEALKAKDNYSLSESFLKLKIYFEDLNYNKYEEQASYELSQLLSDIGGSIGLWIGLSLLSVFELFDLAVEMVSYLLFGRRNFVKPSSE